MGQFIVTHRRAGKRRDAHHRRAREAMLDLLENKFRAGIDRLIQNRPGSDTARHVALMDADPDMVRAHLRRLHPDLIIEPPMAHYAGRVRPPEVGRADPEEHAATLGSGRQLGVLVNDEDGGPLCGVDVFAYFESDDGRCQLARSTNADGRVSFEFEEGQRLTEVAVAPLCAHWSMIHCGEADHVTFVCPALPRADAHLGWWHRRAGITTFDPTLGDGLRVGVIDTGIGPNRNLEHVCDMGAVVDADLDPSAGHDIRGHGSHVAGIIGARPQDSGEYGGLAPGAALHSMRVFGQSGGAHQGDIALAIWAMAHEKRCHLVNLSLGTPSQSEIERDAIVDALSQGCLCICAAGNTSGDTVDFPAAFKEAVAVSALGADGWGPAGSLAAHRVPEAADRFGRDALYLANFSGHGKAVDAAGAGVGLISTVPAHDGDPAPYAAYGGTSMATPYVTGVLAACLAEDPAYRARTAGAERAAHAREQLMSISRDIGLKRDYQGSGLPVRVAP